MGRSKASRWAEEDLDASNAELLPVISPTPYLDAIQRGPQLRTSPLPEHASLCPTIATGTRGGVAVESRARGQGKCPNHR